MTTEGNDQRRQVVQLQETARPRETEHGRRIARALGFHILAGLPVYAMISGIGLYLTTIFWVSWLTLAIIVGLRSAGGGPWWPWTLAWLSLWLVFFVVIFIMLLSAPPDICQDCGAVF